MENQTHEIAVLQRRIDRHLRRCIERAVMGTGVYRGQHQLLMWLGKNPGCSQTELAKMLDISTAAVTTSLQKLEKGGYITRQMNREDNRVNQPEVTEKGRKVIQESIALFQKIDAAMYEGFSSQELDNLQHYYEQILHNLIEMEEQEEKDK